MVALYYATIENLLFDFTINLCYTIIREGGKEPITDRPAGSWKLERRSWKLGLISWKMGFWPAGTQAGF